MTATQQPEGERAASARVQGAEDEACGNQSNLRLQRAPKQQLLPDAGRKRDDDDLPHPDFGEERLQKVTVHGAAPRARRARRARDRATSS